MRQSALSCRVLAAVLTGIAAPVLAQEPKALVASAQTNTTVTEVRGELLSPAGDAPKFRTESGTVYTLVSNTLSSALFDGTNLLGKTLVLKGRTRPGQRSFEVTGNLRSVRDGRVHELHYYCDICAIKTSYGGPCMCCREPVHLIERPVGEE